MSNEDLPSKKQSSPKINVKQLNIKHQKQIQMMKEKKLKQRKLFWEKNRKQNKNLKKKHGSEVNFFSQKKNKVEIDVKKEVEKFKSVKDDEVVIESIKEDKVEVKKELFGRKYNVRKSKTVLKLKQNNLQIYKKESKILKYQFIYSPFDTYLSHHNFSGIIGKYKFKYHQIHQSLGILPVKKHHFRPVSAFIGRQKKRKLLIDKDYHEEELEE